MSALYICLSPKVIFAHAGICETLRLWNFPHRNLYHKQTAVACSRVCGFSCLKNCLRLDLHLVCLSDLLMTNSFQRVLSAPHVGLIFATVYF